MAYRDSTTATGNSQTPAVAVPAGVAADDIVLLAAAIDITAAAFDPADWPTGFTELAEADVTLDGQSMAVGWKRLTGADAGSYTFGSVTAGAAPWVCQAVALSGRHVTDPPVVSANATSNAANTSPVTITANGVTALAGDDLVHFSMPDVNTTGAGTGHTAPAGYTKREDDELTFANLSIATLDNAGAGATGTVAATFTMSGGTAGWAAWLVRVPAAAGGAAPAPRMLGSLGVGT